MFNFIKNISLIERIKKIEKDIEIIKNSISLINNYITLLASKPPSIQTPIPVHIDKCEQCGYNLDGFICSNISCPQSLKNVF